ncbi:MAG TPA: response regulator [Polyangiaceae bacterium]|jgi:two-component system response regulator DesR
MPNERFRLLIVEDDPALGRAVERVLVTAGYAVLVANSCAQARKAPTKFDGAVLDMNLGDGDGVGLAQELLAKNKARVIIFFTASTDDDLARRARALGPIVSKNGEPQELLDAIATELRVQGRA